MASRIEIGFKKGIRDALGEKIRKRIVEHLRIHVDWVKTIEVYTIDGPLALKELAKAARGPLSDPIIQETAINRGLAQGFDWLIEVGFRPGVTDNVGKTAGEAITLLTGKPVQVYLSRQYAISGIRDRCALDTLTRMDAERITYDDGEGAVRKIETVPEFMTAIRDVPIRVMGEDHEKQKSYDSQRER